MVKYASFFKHPTFEVENEWRLIATPEESGKIKYRSGNIGIIPYLEVDLPSNCIDSVTIGPTADKILAEKALRMAFCEKYPDLTINGSKVPLR